MQCGHSSCLKSIIEQNLSATKSLLFGTKSDLNRFVSCDSRYADDRHDGTPSHSLISEYRKTSTVYEREIDYCHCH